MLNLLALAPPAICLIITAYWWLWNVRYAVHQLFKYDLFGSVAIPPYLVGVDFSTVTTLVPLMTSYLTLVGAVRCVKAGSAKAGLWRPHFPYSRPFKTLLVQLGLIGTIVGFIVAFRDLGQVSGPAGYDPKLLVSPLSTALWSTLAGVGFAFLVLPLIEGFFRWAMGSRKTEAQGDVQRLTDAFDGLEQRLSIACDAIGRVNTQLALLEKSLTAVTSSPVPELVRQLIERADLLTTKIAELAPAAQSLAAPEYQRTLRTLAQGLKDASTANTTLTRVYSGLDTDISTLTRALTAVNASLGALQATQEQLTQAVIQSGQIPVKPGIMRRVLQAMGVSKDGHKP